ncbi:hypothetical protein GGI13_002324 [Coemansia sp. RSA 455]|nr:hypothetical protein GGI13_002324 [Coemansia sp. RSA 455]
MFAYISDYILELAFALGIALIILIAARESPAPRKIGIPKAPLSPIAPARLSSLSPLKPPSFTFQTLPTLLVYKIVEYLDCRSKYLFNSNGDTSIISRFDLFPLLSVSERWRKAALESLYDFCHLNFNQSHKIPVVASPLLPTGFPLSWTGNAHLVKHVCVESTLEKALSEGFFCAPLTKLQNEGIVFSAATSLALSLAIPTEQYPSTDDGPRPANSGVLSLNKVLAANFARSIKRLIPSATDIAVFIPSIGIAEINYTLLCNLLVSTLCQGGVKGVHVYAEEATIPISLDVQGLSGLVRICQGIGVSYTLFALLAYHNAGTLQMLGIRLDAEADWRNLVYGGTKVPAIFNSLAVLALMIGGTPYETTWTAIDNVAPFPVLYTLKVSGGYPFDDDLLFRGNGKTMKNLCLPFHALSRNVLGRFKVLSRNGDSHMNSVHIGFVGLEDNAFVAGRGDALIRQQLRRVLETSAALDISRDTPQMLALATIIATPSTHTLQHLDFGGSSICVSGMIKVIAALPGLVSLTCEVDGPDLVAGVKPTGVYLQGLCEKHYPLSKFFKVLRLSPRCSIRFEKLASVAVHIAILCPSFAFVDMPPNYRKSFSREIAWNMVNKPFDSYASSFRHLMFQD